MVDYGRRMLEEINKSRLMEEEYKWVIEELKNPTIGQKRIVSQMYLSAIYDKAGKEILKRYLDNNEVKFINNKGEDCEQYLKSIGL